MSYTKLAQERARLRKLAREFEEQVSAQERDTTKRKVTKRPVSHHLPYAVECPNCHAQMDGATNLTDTDGPPAHGAFTLCAYCGKLLLYQDGVDGRLMLRTPTAKERSDVLADPKAGPLIRTAQVLVLERLMRKKAQVG